MIDSISVAYQPIVRLWDGEAGLIYQSWLRSYIDDGHFTRGVPRQIAFPGHKCLVEGILSKAIIVVITPADDLDQIMGYVVAEKIGEVGVIHFIYVKKAFRRFGFAGRLLNSIRAELHSSINHSMFCTHMTRSGLFLKKHGLVYNPYLLFRSDYHEAAIADAGKPYPRVERLSV